MQNFLPSLPLERFLDGRGDSERPPGRGRPPPNTLVEGKKPVVLVIPQTLTSIIYKKQNILTKYHYTTTPKHAEVQPLLLIFLNFLHSLTGLPELPDVTS